MLSKGVYIIAEVGPNHNGNVNLALEMVDKIASTGVNAIKFQLSDPYMLYSDDSFKANYQKENDKASSAREMSLSFQLSHENHIKIYNRCKELGVDYTCTAFDLGSLKFLDESFRGVWGAFFKRLFLPPRNNNYESLTRKRSAWRWPAGEFPCRWNWGRGR